MFNPVMDDDWEELVPGRLGRLKLNGQRGALHIYSTYFASGSTPQAQASRDLMTSILARSLAPSHQGLSVVCGDFNFVEETRDRWGQSTGAWTGARDAAEAKAFRDILITPHALHELHQPALASETGTARS